MNGDELKASDADLLSFGWAPGGYIVRCLDCGDVESIRRNNSGDKRSTRCREHAIRAMRAALQGDGHE